ncbi:MAG TPA: GspE/PulE family protein [Polyangiales bacterium]|nr:GspE/PulE family protein [Polyangiales bacterium]
MKGEANQPVEGAPAPLAETAQAAQALLDQLLDAALQLRATDVHVEPQADKLTIRLRVEGVLRFWKEVPLDLHPQVVGRLKSLAKLDVAERRRPQEGRFTQATKSGVREYRVATAPMLDGEKVVVRVLHQDLSEITLKNIGYSEPNARAYSDLLSKPHGLILHCGPTGSGKTSALYAAINHLKQNWRNIQTIEDPVEGRLSGINQAQVNGELGQSCATFLRSFLLQDCDVIMVDELRDPESAQLAFQAAHSGHLVLASLQAKSAVAAFSRLHELRVPQFFIHASLVGLVGHRMTRRVCKACRRVFQPSAQIQRECNLLPHHQLYQAVGCTQCGKLGYRGRIGLQEVIAIDPQLREAIQAGALEDELYALAAQSGMISLFTDGVAKCVAGYTTVEEVYQTIMAGD